MTYIPTDKDLLEMSLHAFSEHAKELLGKWDRLTVEQRMELWAIGWSLMTGEKKEAA